MADQTVVSSSTTRSTPQKKRRHIIIRVIEFLLVIVIILLIVFLGVFLIVHPAKPRFPTIVVRKVIPYQLQLSSNILTTQLIVYVSWVNPNQKTYSASFEEATFKVLVIGKPMGVMKLPAMELHANISTHPFDLFCSPIRLDPLKMGVLESELQQGRLTFDFEGDVKAGWKFGPVPSIKKPLKIHCSIYLSMASGTLGDTIGSNCTSKLK